MSTRLFGNDPAREARSKMTVPGLLDKRRRGEPIIVLTAYDYPTARAADAAGADAILVGDSLAMVVLGLPDTLAVTMNEMLHHARPVSRGATQALLIGDMPFMSYQADSGEAVRNAGRFLQEGGMNAVKLEGGRAFAPTVKAIVQAGIPVQGHLGLTPQSLNRFGGWRVQGKTATAARALLDDALTLEDAGCFSIVLESVPGPLAAYITERLEVPTVGIGAGPGTSGQVLVSHDLLGLYDRFTPRFAKRYADLGQAMVDAFTSFRAEVTSRVFPGPEHSYDLPPEEWEAFLATLGEDLPVPALSGR